MADFSTLDIPTLQNMLNDAGSYDERAAIRKAIRNQKAAAGPAKGAAQQSTAYRRPGMKTAATGTPSATVGLPNQYQFVGGSKAGGKATEQKGVKPQSQATTSKSYPSQRDSNTSSSTVDNEKKPTGSRSSGRPVGLTSELPVKDLKEKRGDNIPSPSVDNSKIEDAVTVVTKEEETQDAPEESVDEIQVSGSDDVEILKNAGEHILQRDERESEVEVDEVDASGEITESSAGNAVEVEPSSEPVSGHVTDEESKGKAEDLGQQQANADDAESANQSSTCEFEEDEEEEAIERQIQSTLNYTERKELRARLRQLRKNRKASRTSDGSVSSTSRASVSTHTEAPKPSRAAAPAVAAKGTRVEEPEHTEPASSEPATAAETTEEAAQHPGISIEEVDSGCCLLVEGAKDGEVSPSVKSADLSPVGEFSSQSALSPGEREQDNFADDETSSQASSTSDSSERHCSRTTSGDEILKPKTAVSAALGQNEGVSDFRTVLRKGNSPAMVRKTAGGEQKDFRTVLKKNEAPAAAVVGKAAKPSEKKAEQKDFRGSLKRKVATKDKSSAAPRRDEPAQADFRTVLKKEGTASPLVTRKEKSNEPAVPPVSKKPISPPVKSPVSPPSEVKTPTAPAGDDEVDGLGSSRMTVTQEAEHIELPSLAGDAKPAVSVKAAETSSMSSASSSKATRDLLAMDPLDPSLTYDERKEIRRLQREARRQGGAVAPKSTETKPADQSYEERQKLREEAKRQEELIRRKQRQQFATQLDSKSPQTSPSRIVTRSSGASQLLEWCRRRTMHYENIEIKDFKCSWKNGLAFAALMSSFCPDDIPYDELTAETAERNFTLAFAASEKAGLTPMLDVEDMMICRIPDEKSIMTYVSSIYKHFT